MMKFQVNVRTDGMTEGRAEGLTNLISQDPSSYRRGAKNLYFTKGGFIIIIIINLFEVDDKKNLQAVNLLQ